MTGKELFEIWAPRSALWSPWVAPVLFSEINCASWANETPPADPAPVWAKGLGSDTTIMLDLPGAESLRTAVALMRLGFRPVTAFNVAPGPAEIVGMAVSPVTNSRVAIDVRPIQKLLCRYSGLVRDMALTADAPPAFVLDSRRLIGDRTLSPGMFDNRWMVFPQDFPSASLLAKHGITRAVLVQVDRLQPKDDLAHTLLRWQEAGIEVLAKSLGSEEPPTQISIRKPSLFRAAWQRALAALGLRRSSGGGFGSYIPETTGSG